MSRKVAREAPALARAAKTKRSRPSSREPAAKPIGSGTADALLAYSQKRDFGKTAEPACFPQARLKWLSPTILPRQRRVQELAVEIQVHHHQPIAPVPTDHERLLKRHVTVRAELAHEVGAGQAPHARHPRSRWRHCRRAPGTAIVAWIYPALPT